MALQLGVTVLSVCLIALFASSVVSAGDTVSVQPLSLPPSQYWDGNDGQWSTFHVTIGTPGQRVRLLPGTSATAGDSVWTILPEGCTVANPALSDCPNRRGDLFVRNESTSWSTSRLQNDGLYQLDTQEETNLGLTGNAYYGFDSIQLGSPGSGLPQLDNQLIAGIATNDFWLGNLGLSPLPINFTSYNAPVPSLLGRLRNLSIVPSTSWAYTAGAIYKDPPVFGSLTFGGYDSVRQNDSGISLDFGTDIARDLVVGLQSLTYDTLGSTPLLTDGIYAFIDSMVPQLWLPISVCETFENAFGLVWNETLELYLINDTVHTTLKNQNPRFTFTLGSTSSSAEGGNRTVISLPYSAFDLNMTTSDGNISYFPLKRASNSNQYTLGRVFLQEAYVIVDYDRKNFTVAQAAFPSGSQQALHAILPSGFEVQSRHSLSAGALAGTVIGAAAIVILAAAAAILLVCRRGRRARHSDAAHSSELPKELNEQPFIDSEHPVDKGELSAEDGARNELPVDELRGRAEIESRELYRMGELEAQGQGRKLNAPAAVFELPSVVRPIEMEARWDSTPVRQELP